MKDNLLKTLIVFFIIFVLLSFVIPTGSYNGNFVSGNINIIGIFDIFKYPIYAFATLIQYGMIIILIGIFYGIISKTGAYYNLLDKITKKIKHKKLFIGIIIFMLSLLQSVIGNIFVLLIFVPFVYNLVILLGLQKKEAFASSIGSILIGNISSLCGNALVNTELFNTSLNEGILIKVILLMIITLLYINKVLTKTKLNSKKSDLILCEKEVTKKSTKPLIIILFITFIITILGVFDLSIFGINLFKDMHNTLVNFNIGGFHIFGEIFKGINPLGSFNNYDLMIVLSFISIITIWVYSINLDSIKSGVKEGILKTYKSAIYAILSGIIFVIILNNNSNIMETINNYILDGDYNIFKNTIGTISSTFFYNDYAWLMNSGFGTILLNSDGSYFVISILSLGIHSLLMLILPTSVLLVVGLKYIDFDYKEWIKYIWKYVLLIFILMIVVSIILSGIII